MSDSEEQVGENEQEWELDEDGNQVLDENGDPIPKKKAKPVPVQWKLAKEGNIKDIIQILKGFKVAKQGEEEDEEEEQDGEEGAKGPTLDAIIKERNPETNQTFFMWASINKHYKVVELLVRHGRKVINFTNTVDVTIFEKWEAKRLKDKKKEEGGEEEEEEETGEDGPKEYSDVIAQELGTEEEPFKDAWKIKQIEVCGVYEGEYGKGVGKEGAAASLFVNGEYYVGNFAQNQRNGNGTYVYADGTIYCGSWKKNQRHGQGKMFYPDGSFYKGEWRCSQKFGKGLYSYSNGDYFIGDFANDKRFGFGIYKFVQDESLYKGLWKDDKFIEGVWLAKNGVSFKGAFKDGKPCGKGTYSFNDLYVKQEGVFTSDKKWLSTSASDLKNEALNPPKQQGSLYLIVGSSGVGKDTLLSGAKEKLSTNPKFLFTQRVITRAATKSENNEEASVEEFKERLANNGFSLTWEAHDLNYGIRKSDVDEPIKNGRTVIVSASRAILAETIEKFSKIGNVRVLEIYCDPAIIEERLIKRGRESKEQIQERLARGKAFADSLSKFTDRIRIANVGTIEEGIQKMIEALSQ